MRAVHCAAKKGNTDCLRLLLESGASVDIRDTSGATPLHYAADNNHIDAVKLLLEYGAKACLHLKWGYGTNAKTAQQLAQAEDHFEIATLLGNIGSGD